MKMNAKQNVETAEQIAALSQNTERTRQMLLEVKYKATMRRPVLH